MFSIFALVAFAVMVGIGLAVFVTRHPPPAGPYVVLPEEDADLPDMKTAELPMEKIFAYAKNLCRENKLTIKDKMTISPQETYWLMESTNEFFVGNYVVGFFESKPENPYATYSTILEFKDFIRSVGSSKGLYFTNGFFTRDVFFIEGSKVTLYNKKKLLDSLRKS